MCKRLKFELNANTLIMDQLSLMILNFNFHTYFKLKLFKFNIQYNLLHDSQNFEEDINVINCKKTWKFLNICF